MFKKIALLALFGFALVGAQVTKPVGPQIADSTKKHGLGADSSARFKSLTAVNFSCVGNCFFQDTTTNIRDTTIVVAASGAIDSLWINGGGARFDSNVSVNRVNVGKMPQTNPGAESDRSLVYGRKAGERGKYAPLNIFIGDLAGRGDTVDAVTYPNNMNDIAVLGIWAFTKGVLAIDISGIGNFIGEDCRNCSRLAINGWRSQRHVVDASENVTGGAESLMRNRNGSGNVVMADAGLKECDSCANNDVSGFKTGSWWQDSHYNLTGGAFSGFYYGSNADTLRRANRSLFLGAFSQPLADNTVNENAIGYGAVGYGQYTFTLGNTEITTIVAGGDTVTSLGAPDRRFADLHLYKTAYLNRVNANSLFIPCMEGDTAEVRYVVDQGIRIRGCGDSVNTISIVSGGGAYLFENPVNTNDIWLNRESGKTYIGNAAEPTDIMGGLNVEDDLDVTGAIYGTTVKAIPLPPFRFFNNSSDSVRATDYMLRQAGTLTAPRSVYLKSLATYGHRCFWIQDFAGGINGANTITVRTTGGVTINGALTYVLGNEWDKVEICADEDIGAFFVNSD